MIANPNNNVQENKCITTYIPALSIGVNICFLVLLCSAIKEEDKFKEGWYGGMFALTIISTGIRIYEACEERQRVARLRRQLMQDIFPENAGDIEIGAQDTQNPLATEIKQPGVS